MPPIVERELRVALRRKHIFRQRLIVAGSAVWFTLGLLWMPSSIRIK